MATAWRIVREEDVAGAFSGEGAGIAGGRWNSIGRNVVYTSEHKSLAALEVLVHINSTARIKFKVFRMEFDDDLVETLPVHDLPADWRIEPSGAATMTLGDAWVIGARKPIFGVPSAIIPEELNYLLNPVHPDFAKIHIGPPTDFAFDPRLLA